MVSVCLSLLVSPKCFSSLPDMFVNKAHRTHVLAWGEGTSDYVACWLLLLRTSSSSHRSGVFSLTEAGGVPCDSPHVDFILVLFVWHVCAGVS